MMENKQPPKFADFLLGVFCPREYLEEVKGDLEETYRWRLREKGRSRARLRYYFDIFSAIRLMSFEELGGNTLSGSMLYSFAKSSLRNFRRNRAYAFLNVFGLALGMAAALFILQYVSDELSYDQFEDSKRIYRVSQDFVKNNERLYKTAVTAAPLAPALMTDLPGIETAGRLLDYTRFWEGENIFMLPDMPEKNFAEPEAYFADPAILGLFDLKLVQGSSELNEPNTAMISVAMANKYFGNVERAIGEIIQFSSVKDKPNLLITGVYDFPRFNMQVKPGALVSYATLGNEVGRQGLYQMWGVNSSLTYVKLKEGTSRAEFDKQLADLLLKYNPLDTEEAKNGFRIGALLTEPIEEIHLYSTYPDEVGSVGNAMTVRVLLIVALFIVIIAWVNYINLATAHSLNRLKELGVRKVMGAKRTELIGQFFVEAFIMNTIALVFAVGLVILGQSAFNEYVDKTLGLEAIDLLRFGLPAALFFLSGVICSGLYPLSVFFSSGTVSILKGRSKSGVGGKALRKGLIVFQFLASSLLIMGTLAINRQLNFMSSKDKGVDIDRVLVLDGPTIKSSDRQQHAQKSVLLTNRLNGLSNVLYAGVSNSIPGKSIIQSQTLSRENNKESSAGQFEVITGSEYLKILNVGLIAGKGFDQNGKAGGVTEVVLSKSALSGLSFASPDEAIGTLVYRWYNGGATNPAKVVGVVEDYHHEALKSQIDPMVFYAGNSRDNHYLVKLESQHLSGTIEEIAQIYGQIFPENPVNYYFLDEFFQRQYQSEEVNSNVFAGFATIAILVASLGLFGLSSFIALQRTKEIGVRKVLGAGVRSVFFLLSRELILLAALGFLLAAPLGYYGIDRWLESFAYHISISPFFFVVPLLLVLTVAVLAIGPRVLMTALMNPVRSLRHE